MFFPRYELDAAVPIISSEPGKTPGSAPMTNGSNGSRAPHAWWAFAATRSRRVTALVLGIIALSLFDLHLTLTYLQSGGMIESNPLARLVMSYGSPAALGLWKAASVGLATWILIRARTHRSAEIAAWIGIAVLTWLALQWSGYSAVADDLIRVASAMDDAYLESATGGRWVSMNGAALSAEPLRVATP